MAENLLTAEYGQPDDPYAINVLFIRKTTAELTALATAKQVGVGCLYYDTTVGGFKIGIDAGTVSGTLTAAGLASAVAITGGTINGTTIGAATPANGTFAQVSLNTVLLTGASGRAVNTTASLATITLGATVQSTYIQSPAAAINITLPAVGDGFRTKVTFGAATTVTWTGTVATGTKTTFAAGDSYELVYNAVAGTPTNSAATTWYPF